MIGEMVPNVSLSSGFSSSVGDTWTSGWLLSTVSVVSVFSLVSVACSEVGVFGSHSSIVSKGMSRLSSVGISTF